jgi:hypothetical protein
MSGVGGNEIIERNAMGRVIAAVAMLGIVMLMGSGAAERAHAQGEAGRPRRLAMEHHDTSPLPLRRMEPNPTGPNAKGVVPLYSLLNANLRESKLAPDEDEALEEERTSAPAIPAPLDGWNGINSGGSFCLCLPPDTNGDVGMNHYFQTVNTAFQIWDKAGNSLYGPVPNNTLWDGFGGACENTNDGDPVVLYDHLADRWFFSQFANVFTSGPYFQCIAVSATSDPLGAWHRYSFKFPKEDGEFLFNDYGKFGVWPDAYLMTANLFLGAGWGGTAVLALDREEMLVGSPATILYWNLGPTDWGGMLPADLDGPPPPEGTPGYFVEVQDSAWDPGQIPQDRIQVWALDADWHTPGNSTLTRIANLAVKKFNGVLCGFSRNCVPQKGTTRRLDAISDRGMYRAQYRQFGSYGTIVFNHTVNAGNNRAGIRWYELRVNGGTPSVYQQSTYAPKDGNYRWMGSAALDEQGNLALGFSRSSPTRFPGIFYAGRLASDPLNSLAQGEKRMKAGKGAQLSPYSRWGDYSMLAVDPADGCTFWYTNEFYKKGSDRNWRTWIGKFKFEGCS